MQLKNGSAGIIFDIFSPMKIGPDKQTVAAAFEQTPI